MSGTMDDKDPFKLAENLTKLMESKKLTITTAARRVGMNKSTLHNYCNGVVPRHLRKLKKLAELFGVPLEELMFGPKENRPYSLGEEIEGRFEIIVKRMK